LKLVQPNPDPHKFVIALEDGPSWRRGSLLEMQGNYIYRIISPRPIRKINANVIRGVWGDNPHNAQK
jgi:hypothetical protein